VNLRRLLPADVAASREVTFRAIQALGEEMPEQTPEVVGRGRERIAHLQRTDPESAWVAEEDGEVVGCALALVREGMWFLSLLMVDPPQQSKGLGRALLDATLTTATDRSWILSTAAPSALRRYRRAGFDLVPCLTARGVVDRALLPVVAVREGTWEEHGELVDEVTRKVRGAGLREDLGYLADGGFRVLVADGGYAVLRPAGGLMSMGATDPAVAQELLWAVLAESGDGPVTVDWLAHDQQWAVDVCLDARMALVAGEGHVLLRGQPPMSPYLPGGALG
jgi:predicted N-acetyltransferase YhbS